MKRIILFLSLIAALSLPAAAQVAAPAFELPDADGNTYTLNQYLGKIIVLEWTNYDCPFVRKFYSTGTMQAMQKKYTGSGVVWLSICSSAPGKQGNFTAEEWGRRIRETGSGATAVLLDESGRVGHLYGASNTPHVYVIGRDGFLAYQGAVDDQRTADPAMAGEGRNYLAEALDALLSGLSVPTPQTRSYGCSVKY